MLTSHNRVERVRPRQCTGHRLDLLSVLLHLPAVAVLILQRALEVLLQANDHGALLLDEAPELLVVAGLALLLLPHGKQRGLG
jgi:hypothetical protein